MSDRERIRCRYCGRWIVDVARIRGTAFPVRFRRRLSRWNYVFGETDVDYGESFVGLPEWVIRASQGGVNNWPRTTSVVEFECGSCGHFTTVVPTL